MVRTFFPLLPLAALMAAMGTAQAADTGLAARVEATAAKICGPEASYEGGPRHLFYPTLYKAETATCVRLVTRSALARLAASNSGTAFVALK